MDADEVVADGATVVATVALGGGALDGSVDDATDDVVADGVADGAPCGVRS